VRSAPLAPRTCTRHITKYLRHCSDYMLSPRVLRCCLVQVVYVVARTLHSRLEGRWFSPRPFRFQVITLGKLFTQLHTRRASVTKQYYISTVPGKTAVATCGWEGNRRHGAAAARRVYGHCMGRDGIMLSGRPSVCACGARIRPSCRRLLVCLCTGHDHSSLGLKTKVIGQRLRLG